MPTLRAAPATQPTFEPIGYFIANCSRCHGDYGETYSPVSLAKRDDGSLKEIIRAMCDGPGNAPVDAKAINLLAAYHRAIQNGEPFAAFDSPTGGSITPGATIRIVDGPLAKVEAGRFAFDAAPADDARFELSKAGKSVQKSLPRG